MLWIPGARAARAMLVGASLCLSLSFPPAPLANTTAQTDRQGQARPAFDANVELVTIGVSVLDEDGVPVANLEAADFRITEDGIAREAALLLTPDATPLDIALVVDLSNSMSDNEWRRRASEFFEALAGYDCAFLLGFSTDVGGSVWGPPDDERLHAALRETEAVGGTALFDALLIGLRELEQSGSGGTLRGAARGALNPEARGTAAVRGRANNPCPASIPAGRENDPTYARRKAVVVVSDGIDSTSTSTADDVLTAAELTGIPIFPVNLGGSDRGARRGGGRGRAYTPGRGRWTAAPLPEWAQDGVLQGLATMTGGTVVSASEAGYAELLAWLRGSYIVGYYTDATKTGSGHDFTRHEVQVHLDREGVNVVHQPVYYRPTVDTATARHDVEEAAKLFSEGELQSAMLVLDRAIRADPGYAPAYFRRALVLAELDRLEDAQTNALRAAALSPGVAELHELAMLLLIDASDSATAWEQAIQAAQAGADLRRHFDRLDATGPAPADFDARVMAPRVMVARPYTAVTNLLMETALPKVMQSVRRELAAVPGIGVVVDPSVADFALTINASRLSNRQPRMMEGELVVTDLSGRRVYGKSFLLEDVDSPGRIAANLERIVLDLEDKLQR